MQCRNYLQKLIKPFDLLIKFLLSKLLILAHLSLLKHNHYCFIYQQLRNSKFNVFEDFSSCRQYPSKMWIDVTAFGLPILLTSGNTLYPISFLGSFFPPSLSLSLYYEFNRIGRPKTVIIIPIWVRHYRHLPWFVSVTTVFAPGCDILLLWK